MLNMHCILICFINIPRVQIVHNLNEVRRHSTEHINLLLTISYGKYCFTFLTNQLPIRFLERITFDIRGSTVIAMVGKRIHGKLEHIGLVVRMSILDTEVDGSNPSISMLFP